MSRTLFAAACVALAACATAPEEAAAPVTYTVVEADASIPFASRSVRNYRVGKDEGPSLLLEAGNDRWYRATLDESCSRDLRWEQAIGVRYDATDRLDKFSSVIIDGRRCTIKALDRIEDPDAPTAVAPAS